MLDPREEPDPLNQALSDAKATAQDQLHAAAQLHIDRLLDHLGPAWHSQIQHIFDERLAALAAHIDAAAQTRYQQRRTQLLDHLNQSLRRLRNFESEDRWSRALVDATAGFCGRAALWAVNQTLLEWRAGRNLEPPQPPAFPLASAPAFAGAVESRDTVVALRTRAELSEPLAALTGETPDQRFYLFPLVSRDRVRAILYADSPDGPIEPGALELLASFGAAILDALPAARNAVSLTPPPADPDVHLRAQRFARVQVAEMRLYQSQAVKDGRESADLYATLRTQIDAAREAFRRDFLSTRNGMPDYLHNELVHTLANGNEQLLGATYPGPLV